MDQTISVSIVTERNLLRDMLARLVSSLGSFDAASVSAAMLHDVDARILLVDEGSARAMGDRPRDATVIVLATSADAEAARIAAGMGAAGWIGVDVTPEQLRRALLQAHGDGRIDGRRPTAKRSGDGIALSPREHQVLRGLAAGKKGSEIGRDLGISPHTVRTHIQNLMGKLGASSRVEAVIGARKLGLLEDDRESRRGEP